MTESLKERVERWLADAEAGLKDSDGFEQGSVYMALKVLAAIDELAKEISEIDHYPEDVFKPLTKEQLNFVTTLLDRNGIVVDAYSAHLMRIAEKNMRDDVVKKLVGGKS